LSSSGVSSALSAAQVKLLRDLRNSRIYLMVHQSSLMSGDRSDTGIHFEAVREPGLPELNALVNDPDIAEYLDLIPPVPLEKTLVFWDFLLSRGGLWWNICRAGERIGSVGLVPEQPDTKLAHVATLFIYLKKAYWGAGIGDKAIRFVAVAAREHRIERIELCVVDTNTRAIRLYEKNGFVIEGIRRKAFKSGGRYHDLLMMAQLL
jgi:RimJ/RimL family protein N-acetyltransferase